MTDAVFAADPARLLIAAAAGILLLLLLIIKFKFHPVHFLTDQCTGNRSWSWYAGPDTGRYGGKGSGKDTAGNCTADWSGIIIRWYPGSIGRSTVCCADVGEPILERKGGNCTWNYRTCGRNDGFSLRQVW